ncbi:AI-2E family transporter [Tabrizicola piscis]|uniref:AI-2E family transporter n=1 Tax=Tabrizicola piscis TaxID=2494374 RepID=A0A3S8U4Q3_9RHOB|nr:AI-2E family transporter [Tabrizicola piscis]
MAEVGLPASSVESAHAIVARRVNWATAISICLAAAILHFGSEVFLPLAIATLIAFALSPLISALRRRGMPRILAVLTTVAVAFTCVGGLLAVMGTQVGLVVQSLPTYQSNILSKLDAWTEAQGSSNLLGKFVDMASRINTEISEALEAGSSGGGAGLGVGQPVTVAVVEDQSIWSLLQDVVFPVISPLVTVGLIIVVVIFMLMERDDIRDRFIRLIGANDLHRTTEILEDAGSRVASYLLIQILVNVIYAVPIGLGLWIIGVPNPALWAFLTLILRFVPYIGPIIAATLPLIVAFAASPDWSMVLWTAALFMVVELITSNFIEPRLYGSRTGLSPLAVIIAAIVWTWIWGPMGLILSTPMTVCLVVLGRYLPQFEVFDILFGDEPVLAAHSRLYQRLLSGDTVESVTRAEEALEKEFLADFYQTVGLPALLLAQADYDRGVLTQAQELGIAGSARRFVRALEPVVVEERAESDLETGPESQEAIRIIVAGGRSNLDDVAAQMLAQALAAQGATVTALRRADLIATSALRDEDPPPRCVVLNFLDPNPARASLLIVRRIKRAMPELRVGAVIWAMPDSLVDASSRGRGQGRTGATAKSELESIGTDFIATTMDEAMSMALADEAPKQLPQPQKRPPRQPVRPRPKVAAEQA